MRVQGVGTLPPGAKKGNPKVALVRLRARCRYKARPCSACVAVNSASTRQGGGWIVWPTGSAVRANTTVMLLIVMVLIVGLGTREVAPGKLAGGSFS